LVTLPCLCAPFLLLSFQLRHPNVLQFRDSVEVESADKGGPVTLFLVTEPVQPLSTVLKELQLEDGTQRWAPFLDCSPCWTVPGAASTLTALCHARRRSDDYIAMGLSQVAQTVSFLNVDCKVVCDVPPPPRARLCTHRAIF
jgi:hypothetical protein